MRHKCIILLVISVILTSCGGGGPGGDESSHGRISPQHPSFSNIQPLHLSLFDMKDNPIPYIDVAKVGSHAYYKIRVTNPNPYIVEFVTPFKKDINWIEHQRKLNQNFLLPNVNDEMLYDQPGSCRGAYRLDPGTSCYLYWKVKHTSFFSVTANTTQEVFKIPLKYEMAVIHQSGIYPITVEQCTKHSNKINDYDCSNVNKAGFNKQFVSYKAYPMTGRINFNFNELYKMGIRLSMNGKFAYGRCDWANFKDYYCYKFKINYDNANNRITFESNPIESYLTYSIGEENEIFVAPDGSEAWNTSDLSRIINFKDPKKFYPGTKLGLYSPYRPGGYGLDGSFWWVIRPTDESYVVSVYDKANDTFIPTNIIGSVVGVTFDGTVLVRDKKGNYHCWRKQNNNYQSYASKPLSINGIEPYPGPHFRSSPFGYYISSKHSNEDHPIDTDNGRCDVYIDDFVTALPFTKDLVTNSNGWYIPISKVYLGKKYEPK